MHSRCASRTTRETEPDVTLARQILEIIFERRNVIAGPDTPSWDHVDAAQVRSLAKIMELLDRERPIQMILPAFPAKSSNPEKTLGFLPDYGEVLALRQLNDLCKKIAGIYAPGAHLIICSDGRVFSDLVQVADSSVDDYGREIQSIIDEYGLIHLSTYNLDNVMGASSTSAGSCDRLREMLVEQFADPLDSVREGVTQDPGARQLFNGIHRFLFEDSVALNPEISRNQNRIRTKDLAYSVIQRSNAWSKLVGERFAEAIRLSIHPQPLQSEKIGIRLLPSSDIWRTPWHSSLLFDGKDYVLVRRKDAEDMQATLTHADGKYPYFTLPENHANGGQNAIPLYI